MNQAPLGKWSLPIEATQWHKPGDHPDVEAAGPKLYTRGMGAYITGTWPTSSFWMELARLAEKPVEGDGLFSPMVFSASHPDTGETYYRRVWPFNLWKLKGEKIERELNLDDPTDRLFFQDFEAADRQYRKGSRDEAVVDRVPHGWLRPPAADGRVAVFPGNWIVTVAGKRLILSDEDFRKQYPVTPTGEIHA